MPETTGQARQRLMLLTWGFMTSELVRAALALDLPARMRNRPRAVGELAAETGTHREALTRLLRAMAAVGLTEEREPGHFALTDTASLLHPDAPGSMYALATVFCDESLTRAWRNLDQCVRTGEPAFDRIFGMDYFTHLERNPELSRLFNQAMGEGTRTIAGGITELYDFTRFHTVVDVGGGDGTLLAGVLRANSALRGVLFDTPSGVNGAATVLERAGVGDRCVIQAGDFFDAVPPGGDLYLLKNIIHDWNDERCGKILSNCAQAMSDNGRLLLIELVLPPKVGSSTSPFAYLSDLNMLVNVGGQERTEAEFRDLLASAGLQLTSLTPVPGPVGFTLIESMRAR